MSLAKLNNFANDDTDILAVQTTTDALYNKSYSLTEYDSTTVPAIAIGSKIEVNGSFYRAAEEEAISTTDPVTSSTVADGTVYICMIPSVDSSTCTAAFTATAPTWSDAKQGWYGTGDQANYKYLMFVMKKVSTAYSYKNDYLNFVSREKVFIIANRASTQSNTGTLAKIEINNEIIDLWGDFDASSNYRFTAPRDGYYDISLYAVCNTYDVILYIYVNGSSKVGYYNPIELTSYTHVLCCTNIFLSATDYVEFYADVNAGNGVITPHIIIQEK